MKCAGCDRQIDFYEYQVYRAHDAAHANLCSPSCLVEWAWREKEDQQKLSKSKA